MSNWRTQFTEAVERRPFLRLIHHFAQRTVGGADTASDVDLGIGGILALLAAPGGFTSLVLMNKYSTLMQWFQGNLHFNVYRASVADEYFFVVYSMAITGLVILLRWDHLLPGRRDFMNLAPLPIPLRSIFLANVAALAGTALLFAVDVNLASSLLFPLFVAIPLDSGAALVQIALAHASAVFGVSLFTFLALLATQGLLMALLPEAVYRRVSLLVRTVLLVFFFAILLSAFVMPLSVLNFRMDSRLAGLWWPPVWFVSLFENELPPLRSRATLPPGVPLWAIAAAFGAVIVSFSLSYRRYFLRIPERSEGPTQSWRKWRPEFHWISAALWFSVRCPAEGAVFQFALRTLLRNETHLLFFGLWVGLGAILALESLNSGANGLASGNIPTSAVLAAPLILVYFMMAGLRFVFDVPASLEANWVFRLAAAEQAFPLQIIWRKLILFFTLPVLTLLWLPFAAIRLGPSATLLCFTMDVLLLLAGCELAVLRCRKIPFTCSFAADRDRMLKVVLSSLLVLLLAIPMMVSIESRILLHPMQILFYGGATAGAIFFFRRNATKRNASAVFEDKGIEAFALLRLAGD